MGLREIGCDLFMADSCHECFSDTLPFVDGENWLVT